jgi:hypothetical protein
MMTQRLIAALTDVNFLYWTENGGKQNLEEVVAEHLTGKKVPRTKPVMGSR